MSTNHENGQVQKTRQALVSAFNHLMLDQQRYHAIKVGDILEQSDVGRSTFYEHFRDKNDLLRHSMAGILSILASAVEETCDLPALEKVLAHFQENCQLVRGMANGPSCQQLVRPLAEEMASRLPGELKISLPISLIATQMAESQVGLIRAWLNGGMISSARDVARAMHQSALGLKRAYIET